MEENIITESATMVVTKLCPFDGRRLVQVDDPDFGLCWSCLKVGCGYLEPVE